MPDSFREISEKGKQIASRLYEGVYKIPVANRIVGKLEIVYNQFWIDRHQEKNFELKEKKDNLDLKIDMLDQSKSEITSAIEYFKQQNIPGSESLLVKIQDIEKQKMKLLNEKDKIQSKLEERDNKISLYTNERDRIANRLINYYEGKVVPLDKELEELHTRKDKIDLLVTVTQIKHEEQIRRLQDIERKKEDIEKTLRGVGMSERQIKKFPAIRQIEENLSIGYQKIKEEREKLSRYQKENDEKMAKIDAKANPYRDKIESFKRIKEGRPVRANIGETEEDNNTVKNQKEIIKTQRRRVVEGEKGAEEQKYPIRRLIRDWQMIIEWNERYTDRFTNGKLTTKEINIYPADFFKETELPSDIEISKKDFINIVKSYFKTKKIPEEKYEWIIDYLKKNNYG